jgi:hypothetical protein
MLDGGIKKQKLILYLFVIRNETFNENDLQRQKVFKVKLEIVIWEGTIKEMSIKKSWDEN